MFKGITTSVVILTILGLFSFTPLVAQVPDLSGIDFTTLKTDELTDEQVQALSSRMKSMGITSDKLETAALAKGMPAVEVRKLKSRMNRLETLGPDRQAQAKTTRTREEIKSVSEELSDEDMLADLFSAAFDTLTVEEDPRERIYGYSLFNSKNLTFEPSANMPTPVGYILGPGDEVIIDIWGASQNFYELTVSPDGYVVIENIGPVKVSGLTIEKASQLLINRLSAIYSGLRGQTPSTFAQVSIGDVRTIKVILIGETEVPGSYSLSSLATAFNALYLAGGPGINGSMRSIDLVRSGKVISSIDVYDFLLNGDKTADMVLSDQDVIRVNPYGARVDITGEVKRPLTYEVVEGETLNDLLRISGGFSGKAYTHRLKIYRNTTREREIVDVPSSQYGSQVLQDGDSVVVEKVLDRFENRVEIRGALYRSGEYALEPGLSLKGLIDKAEGLRGDAFMTRTLIYRTMPDHQIEALSVDLGAIMAGTAEDILLQREDVVVVPSIFDLQEDFWVSISGEVLKPGEYPYVLNSTLQDVIVMAGGLLESASLAAVEVSRRLRDNTATTSTSKEAEIFTFTIRKDLGLSADASGFTLEPFDRIYIRRSPGYREQSTVQVEGEVIFPGEYTISNKTDRISDIVVRTGGLTPEAYPLGAKLIRKLDTGSKDRLKMIENITAQSGDSIVLNEYITETEQAIGINLERILQEPGSKYDILLEEGDVLSIPKKLETVRLSGALLRPVSVRYDEGRSFRDYIDNAGGYSDEAKKSKSYVLYANGSVNRTRNLLFMRNYPSIEPGAEIIVPLKDKKEGISAAEAVSLGSAVASLSLIIVTLINAVK
jgi:protein involved in polysaccharide export with SLBB domain